MIKNDYVEELVSLLQKYANGLTREAIIRKSTIRTDASFYRALKKARSIHGYVIDTVKGKYVIQLPDDYEEHGVQPPQYSDTELIALLSLRHILSSMSSESLKELFAPFNNKLDTILQFEIKDAARWAKKIRILDIHHRTIGEGVFSVLLDALTRKKVVKINYSDADKKKSIRTISPQRILRYRDNWYCDAWCHQSEKLKTFALAGIEHICSDNKKFHPVKDTEIEEIVSSSYGIFSGTPKNTAVIRFTGKAARYILLEEWHPKQIRKELSPTCVELQVPYNNPTELIRQILFWGSDAAVIAPESLRKELMLIVDKMGEHYKKSIE
jgi:predicted DNA-binding transcriptional regulator YafY